MAWARTTPRSGTPVQITVIDLVAKPGSTCTGFVSDLAPTDSPHSIEHTCEESFLKMMFPDHWTTRELEKITQPLRTVVKRLGVAPLVQARQAPFALSLPCGSAPTATALHDTLHHTIVYSCKHALVVKDRHGRIVAEHTLRVLPCAPGREPICEAASTPTDEEHVVKRNLWVFPRVDRLGSVLTNKAAAFSISVPNANNATAGELLFINMTAFCGIRPRAIKLSIRRTMRCRLNAPATRAALPPFRKALITSASADSATPPAIVSRSTARYNALSTRAHTLPPGVVIPSVATQGNVHRSLQHGSSVSASTNADIQTRQSSLPVILAATELCDTVNSHSGGSRNGRRSGTESQQTVEFVATVQRVIIGKPFGYSFDGCFYIRIPQTCFSVKTDLVEVQHHLSVSLRFGMGRSLKKQVPVHIHQMEAGSAGTAHVSTSPPCGWQGVFDLAGARASSRSECPICFDYMHPCGSRRPSTESERRSFESAAPQSPACEATCSQPQGDAAEGAVAMHSQQPDEAQSSGSSGASTSSNPAGRSLLLEGEPSALVWTCCGGCCSSDAGCGVPCGRCGPEKAADAVPRAAPHAVEGGSEGAAGGQVLPVVVPAGTAQYDGSAVVSTASYSSSGTASDDDSDVNAAVVRECHVVEPDSGPAHERDDVVVPDDGTPPPPRLPASMSSPVPLVGLISAAPAGAAGIAQGGETEEGSSSVEGCTGEDAARKCAAPPWLKEDLVVTDCGHVFHSVCLLRHEHAHAARAGTSASSPQCPVCRRVYRRYLGAMCAALT